MPPNQRVAATCNMRYAMCDILGSVGPRWTLLDPSGQRWFDRTLQPFDLVFHSISLTGLMGNESNATVVTYRTILYRVVRNLECGTRDLESKPPKPHDPSLPKPAKTRQDKTGAILRMRDGKVELVYWVLDPRSTCQSSIAEVSCPSRV